MTQPVTPELAAALVGAQGVAATPEAAAAAARFATLVLGNSAEAFAQLAFEDEPSGYTAALLGAQGVATSPETAAAAARFATLVLGSSAKAFAQLAFEEEPSGYTAALRRNAP